MKPTSSDETPTPQTNELSAQAGLAPCPFCGNDVAKTQYSTKTVYECHHCWARTSIPFSLNTDKHWNERVPLISSLSTQSQVTKEKEEHGWIRTADRLPTKEDGDEFGDVWIYASETGRKFAADWEWVCEFPDLCPFWMPIPKLPDETPKIL